MKWATSHGVQAHKMAIGEFAYEDHLAEGDYWLDSIRLRRGLLAVESISEGEVLVSLPWRSCITTEHLRASKHPLAGMAANEQDKTLEQHEMLALFLLYEYHQPNSAWAPYLCMLPRKLTSPIFWPTSMLEMIPSGPLLEKTVALKKTLAQRFEETVAPAVGRYKSVFPADVLTLPNFLWAIGTVKARNWGMSWKGKTLSFLAPLADLVNHHSLKGGGAHLSYLSMPAPPGYGYVTDISGCNFNNVVNPCQVWDYCGVQNPLWLQEQLSLPDTVNQLHLTNNTRRHTHPVDVIHTIYYTYIYSFIVCKNIIYIYILHILYGTWTCI